MSVKQKQQTEGHQKCQKNLARKQQQYRHQKALLTQQIEFLQQQLRQYRQRQTDNKKINESIMITYQQNENIRQQHISRSLKMMTEKHQEEIVRLKDVHHRQVRALEETLAQFKDKYEHSLIENDKRKVQYQRKMLEMQRKYQQQIKEKLDHQSQQHEQKISVLMDKLKKAEGVAQVYQQFVQKRKLNSYEQQENYVRAKQASKMRQSNNNFYLDPKRQSSKDKQNRSMKYVIQSENPSRISRQSRIRDIQQNNLKDLKRLSVSRQSVRQLTVKIQRAVTQLRGSNNFKLHQKINEKLSKRM